MTRFDLGTQGFAELQGDLEELAQKGDGDAVYKVEVGAEYATFLEFGTRDMPPYPYFRPAIVEFQANPEDFILDNTYHSSIEDIPNANALVQAVASALETQMKTNATAQASDRSPGTHPDHPQVDTDNLRASISATRLR